MKKMVFIACALMVVAAGSAMAGSNLAWTDCLGGGGLTTRTNACTNTGSVLMYATFQVPNTLTALAAVDTYVDVEAATSVNSWWLTSPIGTRWAASNLEPASGVCPTWASTVVDPALILGPTPFQLSPSRMRLTFTVVIAAGQEQTVNNDGTEYFTGALQLKNNAGTAQNAECQAGAAIGIADMVFFEPGQNPLHDESPATTNCITFRTPAGKTCPGATPTRKATWGSIKALYR